MWYRWYNQCNPSSGWSPTGLAVPSLQDPSSHLPWTCHLALAPASWSKRKGRPQVKCGPSSMVFSWFQLISVDFSWFRLISVDFDWFQLISVDFGWVWTRLAPSLAWFRSTNTVLWRPTPRLAQWTRRRIRSLGLLVVVDVPSPQSSYPLVICYIAIENGYL